jgi:hypothetical protein
MAGPVGLRFFSVTVPLSLPAKTPPRIPMINAIKSLNPIAVIVISIIAFVFGGLWFSPLLFVKAWMKEVKMTPESAKAAGAGQSLLPKAFAMTLISTFSLAVLIAAHHTSGALKGGELGLFVGAGVVASRQATNAIFELKSLRYVMIIAGHDIAQFTLVGAILGVWR